MDITQEAFVIRELENAGCISRNFCLQNYITRLGAIICNLNKKGWNITGEYVEYNYGKDFIYTLISKTKKIQMPEKKKSQEQLFRPGYVIK
jgi:hypothetical protein